VITTRQCTRRDPPGRTVATIIRCPFASVSTAPLIDDVNPVICCPPVSGGIGKYIFALPSPSGQVNAES